MEQRIITAKCRQLLAEYEDMIAILVKEIESEERARPNTGTDAFAVARQVIEANGMVKGMSALLGRIKTYAGKQ